MILPSLDLLLEFLEDIFIYWLRLLALFTGFVKKLASWSWVRMACTEIFPLVT
jgi:hypothetical protein